MILTTIKRLTTAYNADGEINSTGDNFSHYAYTYTGQGEVASVDNAGTPGVPDVLLNSGYDTCGQPLVAVGHDRRRERLFDRL
jgi:hypothetical protein